MTNFEAALAATQNVRVKDRQERLIAAYREIPQDALVTDRATTRNALVAPSQALHTMVTPDNGAAYPIGVHKAVGGESDVTTPGDLLCAAIAACLDSTIRLIANRIDLTLTHLVIDVEGDVDVRGALLVCPETPVGFQRFRINVELKTTRELPETIRQAIVAGAENSCVILQTINGDADISINIAELKRSAA